MFGTAAAESRVIASAIRAHLSRDHSLLLPNMLDEVLYVMGKLLPESEDCEFTMYSTNIHYELKFPISYRRYRLDFVTSLWNLETSRLSADKPSRDRVTSLQVIFDRISDWLYQWCIAQPK